MPTASLKSFLDRDLSKAYGREFIDIATSLLQELVNHGTHAFVRFDQCAIGKVDVDSAPLTLYRYIIEIIDGIEVLISECCPAAAIPLLRSAFESLLYLEYILENEEKYAQRSLSWFLWYIHERLDSYERLDPLTLKGKDFKNNLDNDKDLKHMSFPIIDDAPEKKINLEKILSKPHIQPIENEYQKKKKGKTYWFQLFDGPNDLRLLAKYLKRGSQYDQLYRHWTKVSHVREFFTLMDSKGNLKRLRDPSKICSITVVAAFFMITATRLMIDKFRKGENLQNWYNREIKKQFDFMVKNT